MERVLVQLPLAKEHWQRVAQGVGRFRREHRGLELIVCAETKFQPGFAGDIDGVVFNHSRTPGWEGAGVPGVNVSASRMPRSLPTVTLDGRATGRMAGGHLVERGFGRLGFVGNSSRAHYQAMREGVSDAARDGGLGPPAVCGWEPKPGGSSMAELDAWLAGLDRPIGIVCIEDTMAAIVVSRLKALNVAVPDEVGIIGVDNDALHSSLSLVPLSSVDPGSEQIGYEAAALLMRLIDGEAPPDRPVLIPPAAITVRESTDTFAFQDDRVLTLWKRVRDRATDPALTGEALFEEIPLSRRSLEMKFKQRIGQTVWEQVRATRLSVARRLLLDTRLPIGAIADRAGYTNHQRMTEAFRDALGISPSAYRRDAGSSALPDADD